MTRRCQSKSKFGDCWRYAKHEGMHAVAIGPAFWFGYARRTHEPVGYVVRVRGSEYGEWINQHLAEALNLDAIEDRS